MLKKRVTNTNLTKKKIPSRGDDYDRTQKRTKSSKLFKPSIHNFISTRTRIKYCFSCTLIMGCVKIAWYCIKMQLFFTLRTVELYKQVKTN